MFGQQNEVVSAGLVTAVTFMSSPQTTNVGQLAGPITISVGFANEVVNLSSSSATGVFYNSTGPGAAVITSVVTDASGNASFYYEDPTTGTPTLTATDAGTGITGTQMETVNPGAAINFTTSPISTPAGQQGGPVTIQVTDENSVGVANEQVLLSSTSGTGTFYTATGAPLPKTVGGVPYVVTDANGNASFLYEDSAVGSPTLTAAADAAGSVSKTQTETVTAGVVTSVTFTTLPVTASAGKQSTAITIAVKNGGVAVANEVVKLSSTSFTGNFYNSITGVALPKTTGGVPYVVTDANGNASFLYEDTAVGSPRLTATAIGAAGPVSGFQIQTVNAGVATAIAFTTLPTTADPGQEAGPITIQVLNGGAGIVGEVVNLSTDSLTGTFYDANGNIITSVITGGGGNASFFYMDTSPGSPNLTATDSAKPAITATQTETVSTAGVALERGGQMNVLYSTITGAAVKIQQSQPDGGLANNLVAATGVATVNPNTPILAAITTPGSNPPSKYIPVMSTATLTVAAANFDFNGGAAFGKIDDVEATIDIQFPTMQTLSIVLIPPTGSGLARSRW